MRTLLIVFVLLATSCSASDVIDLTEDNFDNQTSQGTWLLEFYAPRCRHCEELAPIYEEIATKLKGSVNVGKIDCTVHKALSHRFSIQGFPTIKFLKEGKLYDYTSPRTVTAFEAYVNGEYTSQPSKSLPLAKETQPDEPAAEQAAPEAAPTPSDVYVLSQSNFDTITADGDWLLEFYAPWCGHCKQLAPTYEKVATALKGKVHVGKVDCTVETALSTRFGIKAFPTIKFLKAGTLYEFKSPRTLDAFIAFVDGGYTSAEMSLVPQPKPVENPAAGERKQENAQKTDTKEVRANKPPAARGDQQPAGVSDVIILTNDNFDEKTKMGDWLVEFYAPWCGHCKRLKPTYEKVATTLKGKVNVAKVDCTVEKAVCSLYGVAGYPTIAYLHDGQKYSFSGVRTVDAFVEFVESGWKEAASEALPEPRSAFEDAIIHYLSILETQNVYIWVGICVGLGLLLGLLIVALVAPSNNRPQQQLGKHD